MRNCAHVQQAVHSSAQQCTAVHSSGQGIHGYDAVSHIVGVKQQFILQWFWRTGIVVEKRRLQAVCMKRAEDLTPT